jgi:hypothetical protein
MILMEAMEGKPSLYSFIRSFIYWFIHLLEPLIPHWNCLFLFCLALCTRTSRAVVVARTVVANNHSSTSSRRTNSFTNSSCRNNHNYSRNEIDLLVLTAWQAVEVSNMLQVQVPQDNHRRLQVP